MTASLLGAATEGHGVTARCLHTARVCALGPGDVSPRYRTEPSPCVCACGRACGGRDSHPTVSLSQGGRLGASIFLGGKISVI